MTALYSSTCPNGRLMFAGVGSNATNPWHVVELGQHTLLLSSTLSPSSAGAPSAWKNLGKSITVVNSPYNYNSIYAIFGYLTAH